MSVNNIEAQREKEALSGLKKMSLEDLKKAYNAREIEPDMAEEFWKPSDKTYLVVL